MDSAKGSRGDLKLDATEKRKLAPLQAYCSYVWESTLRTVVSNRWDVEKASETFDDDDDDPGEEYEAPPSASPIPLAFKLKIAKEYYDALSQKEKEEIERRREKERSDMYRRIPDIKEDELRIKKLRIHQKYGTPLLPLRSLSNVSWPSRNQAFIAKSLTHILANLEDQTGCVAQLFVASVDPAGGSSSIQK